MDQGMKQTTNSGQGPVMSNNQMPSERTNRSGQNGKQNNVQSKNMHKKHTSRLLKRILILLVLVGIVAGLYYRVSHSPSAKQAKAKAEMTSLTKSVSKLMIVPEGEPIVFDVTDPESLTKQQVFFAGAQKGDKLLIYNDARKAVIYSPSRDIIVNVGPVTFDQNQAAPAGAAIQPAAKAPAPATTVTPVKKP